MGVTITHTAVPPISGWYRECGCGKYRSETFPTHAEAATGENGCPDTEFCVAYPALARPVYVGFEPMTVEPSCDNARHILTDLLSLVEPWENLIGGVPVAEFRIAVLRAVPTNGKQARTTVRVGGELCEVIGHADLSHGGTLDCGRAPGYDKRILEALMRLTSEAMKYHAERIVWG